MMKIKLTALALLSIMLSAQPSQLNAQQLKQFTLEDLNFGGTNYKQMTPATKDYRWWGDELLRIDKENIWLVDKKTHKEVLLTDKQKEQYEEWKKEQQPIAEIKDHNLFVGEHQLTIDGSREIVYGEAVHRNEFGIMEGLFWSPDHKRLAFYRMDQSMVSDYPQVNIFKRSAAYEPDKYPMAGEETHFVNIGIYDVEKDETIYLITPNVIPGGNAKSPFYFPNPSTSKKDSVVYFTNISWAPDSKTLYVQELNRDQNDCRLVSYDAMTGLFIAELNRETSDKYVEPLHPIQFLPWDASKFIMQSQKDGYNHLYLFNKDGKQLKQLTSGPWVVLDVLGFNAKKKSVIISSNEASPIQQNLYAVNVATGKRTPLDNQRGWHRGMLSESGQWLIDNYSEPDIPRVISLVNTTAKPSKTPLFEAPNPWEGYQIPTYECGTIKAADDQTDLYYRMVKPADFNPSKKYPTVIYVYGGPHAHNVDARWHYSSRSWETYMAQKGYVLFILDNRGSENRGLAFEQATFRQLGQIEMQDQMKGVEFLRTLPYVDMNRLGVHGWSFGGFMTISLMTNYPDVFKVGVAGGPVIDWKWYEVMYGERYMDTPQSNPEGYEKTSLLSKAKDLKGKLQIITGYNDATVVPQHCLSFLAECIKAGTQPDFFAYPGEPHNMRGHQSVHLHERITQYFEDYLK